MTCRYRLASGLLLSLLMLLLLYISFWVLHHPEKKCYSRTEARDMASQWLFWHLCAGGSWYFLPAAMSQIRLVWREHRVCVHIEWCLFAWSVDCALCCVCLCSLCLTSVKKLGHNVCNGACSNYGQLCSLNALPHCTLLLHQPDDIPTILQYTLSLTASSGDL